jgi:hypothetical protein
MSEKPTRDRGKVIPAVESPSGQEKPETRAVKPKLVKPEARVDQDLAELYAETLCW